MSEDKPEIIKRRNDLVYQLGLAEECIAENSVWPYVFERTVVLLAKAKRYDDALRICIYVEGYCKREESQWDGSSAKVWKSPALEKCIERIPKLEAAIAKARGDEVSPDYSQPYYWWERIVALPLADQCAEIGIAYQKITGLNFSQNPEKAALKHFSDQGWQGSYCEGGAVLVLIRAAALDILEALNPFKSREDACRRFTEAQLEIHRNNLENICDTIRKARPELVRRNFREIYQYDSNQRYFPGLQENVIVDIFNAIGGDGLARMTQEIGIDPYKYRKGWPDLTLVNQSGRLRWIEIKTTDKLHRSQIETLTHMLPCMLGTVEVLQLV